jgi:hypothetical protein
MRFKPGKGPEPGLRERRVSRVTGTTVSIYDGYELSLAEGVCEHRWITRCEDHGAECCHPTLAEARAQLSGCEWCYNCQLAAQGGLIECVACGCEVSWHEERDDLGEPLCEDGDAMLLDEHGETTGARISQAIYCAACAGLAIRNRCEQCSRERELGEQTAPQLATTPLLHALATGTELSILAAAPPGRIEVVDLEKLPKPPPGSWAALLRRELLNARKGEN